ncbi:4-hydroxybenzoate polyprenyl transferase [Lactifluus subvellereus]|nr:4-hydroxybenzoate polyprenyl transferase [Lactifluus subvellereus]
MVASTSPSTGPWRWVELSRIHKFAGSMLMFWPFAWGMTLAARPLSLPLQEYAFHLAHGLVGATLLHGTSAGCVWNDILDRDFDKQVARTKRRPIADGRVSVPGALVFLAIHLVVLVGLLWPCNALAWNLGLVTVFPLAGIYPLMKRVTYWPQAWLGVAMNTIALVAWSALHADVAPASVALFVGCWSWTLYYDTIYALQDKRDDVQAGVKSTAILFGEYVKAILALFAGLLVACLTTAGVLNGQGVPYFALTVGGTASYLIVQLLKLDVDDPKSCFKAFESNGFTLGGIVWGGLFVDYLLG